MIGIYLERMIQSNATIHSIYFRFVAPSFFALPEAATT